LESDHQVSKSIKNYGIPTRSQKPTQSIENSASSVTNNSALVLQLQKAVGNRAVMQFMRSNKLIQMQPNEPRHNNRVIQLWSAEDMEENLVAINSNFKSELTRTQFRTAIQTASALGTPHEQAASLANAIKSNQYFQDGNTRVATAAVFHIFREAGNKKLKVSPLQVLAAIGVHEIDNSFDFSAWIDNSSEDSETPQEVPSGDELNGIHDKIAVIGEAVSRLNHVLGRWYQYKRDNQTEAEAREEFANDSNLNSRGTFEELYEVEEFMTEDGRKQNFIDDLDFDDEEIWDAAEQINAANRLIKPTGNNAFADTVGASEDIKEMSSEELLGMLEAIQNEN
jgi:hypothetical protein